MENAIQLIEVTKTLVGAEPEGKILFLTNSAFRECLPGVWPLCRVYARWNSHGNLKLYAECGKLEAFTETRSIYFFFVSRGLEGKRGLRGGNIADVFRVLSALMEPFAIERERKSFRGAEGCSVFLHKARGT